ncbi:MAG: hypothetical protein QG635_2059 [Bacteroidota bacterium]|nr:hypothetical protein [Bacteroidota bacterium]
MKNIWLIIFYFFILQVAISQNGSLPDSNSNIKKIDTVYILKEDSYFIPRFDVHITDEYLLMMNFGTRILVEECLSVEAAFGYGGYQSVKKSLKFGANYHLPIWRDLVVSFNYKNIYPDNGRNESHFSFLLGYIRFKGGRFNFNIRAGISFVFHQDGLRDMDLIYHNIWFDPEFGISYSFP